LQSILCQKRIRLIVQIWCAAKERIALVVDGNGHDEHEQGNHDGDDRGCPTTATAAITA
jgi:hypothetical protein